MITTQFLREKFKPSFRILKLDIYKCPKSKNEISIWKKVVTKK
jgi:hypothetical protein